MNSVNSVTEAPTKKFADELRAAEQRLQSAQATKRLADHRVSDFEAGISNLRKTLQIHPMLRPEQDEDQLKADLRITEEKFRGAQTAAAKAADEVKGAESTLARIRSEIAGVPAYAKAVEKLRNIWRDAHEISLRAWHETPILKLDADFQAFDRLVETEEKVVAEINADLRAARLPEFTARLRNGSGQLLPHHAVGTHLRYLADGAAAERARLL